MSNATSLLVIRYVPASVPTFASNLGKRSTLTSSEERDILNFTKYLGFSMDFNCHGSPFQLLFKRDSRSVKMRGSFLLNCLASLILFMTITQSKSECFFSAVPFAMDPPYKEKVDMQNPFIVEIFQSFSCYILATSRPLSEFYSSRRDLQGGQKYQSIGYANHKS